MGIKGEIMTVKEVLALVAEYLGDTALKDTTQLGGTETATDQQAEKLNLLLTCVNDVTQSLATMYFPLKYEEIITNSNDKVQFSTLTKPVLDILKIVDERGYDVDFSIFPTYFEAKNGKLRVIYTYLPQYSANFTDSVEIAVDKVSKRLFAIGVVSRYYLMSGMFSDADAWEVMFERAILMRNSPKSMKTVKKRRWI